MEERVKLLEQILDEALDVYYSRPLIPDKDKMLAYDIALGDVLEKYEELKKEKQ